MPRPPKPLDPLALDVARWCRDAAHLQGEWLLDDLPRLCESVLRAADGHPDAPVTWAAAGFEQRLSGGGRHFLIDLELRTEVRLACQRCLVPMPVPIDTVRRFRFVDGEDEAARLDEEAGDDEDVLALVPRLDLRALAEDELLLALPLVPRHEACPQLPLALREEAQPTVIAGAAGSEQPARAGDAQAGNKPSPFAALAVLRDRKR